MVHVEVQDGDPAEALGPGGEHADGDVVDQAEAHGTSPLRVVPARPDRGEGVAARPVKDGAHSLDHRAAGCAGRPHGASRHVGVRVEAPASGGRRPVQEGDIGGVVRLEDQLFGGRRRGDGVETKPGRVDRVEDRLNPGRSLRMSGVGMRVLLGIDKHQAPRTHSTVRVRKRASSTG